ncbi:MAG: RNA polymerase subunit sigma-70 [Candidatus Limnocylindria bacterium]
MAEPGAALELDDETFGPITEALRRDLLLHCYRFSGSVHDAEDMVQETLARAWRGRADYRGEAGPRTWLRRIATRVCLDALRRSRGRRLLPSSPDGARTGEILWLEPIHDDLIADAQADPAASYDLRESVSLAFLAALQLLPPRQRAVLILRDVLALRAAEVADQLETTVPSVNSLLHRARRTMEREYRPSAAPRPPDASTARLLRRYVLAWEAGDIAALLALLKRDAVLEMPPIPSVSIGHAAIRAFLAGRILDGTQGRWRGVTTEANGGPAVGLYQREGDGYRFSGLQLLALDGDQIGIITAYMDASLAGRFHLPDALA